MTTPAIATSSPHCDEIIEDCSQPFVLRRFLHYARLPAVCKMAGAPAAVVSKCRRFIPDDLQEWVWTAPEPVLYADYRGGRVRVVMASRFGDVGITKRLKTAHGYDFRVGLNELSNFGTEP